MSTGYIVAFKFFHPPIEVCPVHMQNKKIWNSVWALKVPNKVRIFMWKLAHEGIPARVIIKRRLPNVEENCPRCGLSPESVIHCIVSCPYSEEVWRMLELHQVGSVKEQSHFSTWWSNYMDSISNIPNWKEVLNWTALTFWQIWKTRNNKVFEGQSSRPQEVVKAIRDLIQEIKETGSISPPPS